MRQIFKEVNSASGLMRKLWLVQMLAWLSWFCLLPFGSLYFAQEAPGFVDFHANPFVLSRTFGTVLQHQSLDEFFALTQTIAEAEISADVEKVKALGLPYKGVDESDLPTASRAYLAMRKLIDDNNFDGLAIRCWPEMNQPNNLQQWPYVAIARLASEGFAVSCEGDVDGALGCFIAKILGCGTCYLSDWLEHTADTVTLWHGGMAPFQLSESIGSPLGPCLARHFNTKHAGVVNASIRIGMNVTVFRVWVMDGCYHAITFEGTTVAPSRNLLGNHGVVQLREGSMVAKFEQWVQHGFPHHVCVVEGWVTDRFEAFAQRCAVKLL